MSQPHISAAQGPVQVSVVIPAYNSTPYIANTLRSVFAQTFSDFEAIVVNDGSPDADAFQKELKPYMERIRYFSQPNRGPSSARNLGIREARGEYIAFLDSDDLWLPRHLERQMETLRAYPDICLVYANSLHLKNDTPVAVAFDSVHQSGEPTLEALLLERCTINTSSAVVKRGIVVQAGLFDENMNRCEDFDLWLRVAATGGRIAYSREIQVCHRLTEGLSANRIGMKQGRMRAYKKAAAVHGITQEQRDVIQEKLKELDQEIQTELTKQLILAGDYERALSAAAKASSSANGGKIHFVQVGLRYFPGLFRRIYSTYVRFSEYRKLSKKRSRLKGVDIAGEPFNLESLIGRPPAG